MVNESETLRGLETRLMQASVAAERLLREAAERVGAERAGGTETEPEHQADQERPERERPEPGADQEAAQPGADREPPEPDERAGAGFGIRAQDLELLERLLERFRDLIPPDLQRRLANALRELLLALRALTDWYLERLERRRAQPPEVKDIPIL